MASVATHEAPRREKTKPGRVTKYTRPSRTYVYTRVTICTWYMLAHTYCQPSINHEAPNRKAPHHLPSFPPRVKSFVTQTRRNLPSKTCQDVCGTRDTRGTETPPPPARSKAVTPHRSDSQINTRTWISREADGHRIPPPSREQTSARHTKKKSTYTTSFALKTDLRHPHKNYSQPSRPSITHPPTHLIRDLEGQLAKPQPLDGELHHCLLVRAGPHRRDPRGHLCAALAEQQPSRCRSGKSQAF